MGVDRNSFNWRCSDNEGNALMATGRTPEYDDVPVLAMVASAPEVETPEVVKPVTWPSDWGLTCANKGSSNPLAHAYGPVVSRIGQRETRYCYCGMVALTWDADTMTREYSFLKR